MCDGSDFDTLSDLPKREELSVSEQESNPLKVLDLCCGLKGFSRAFRDAGCDVTTVDIDARLNPDICADVRTLNLTGYEIVLAAPPCIEYSRKDLPWTRETAPGPDRSIWQACERIARECDARLFCLENVRGAIPYHGKPQVSAAPRFFWGYGFSGMQPPSDVSKRNNLTARWVRDLVPDSNYAERRYWARSYISREVSAAIYAAAVSPRLFYPPPI